MKSFKLQSRFLKLLKAVGFMFLVKIFFITIFISFSSKENNDNLKKMFESYINLRNIGIKSDYPKAVNFEKKDWHDYEFIKLEMKRTGIGEQGEGHQLTDQNDFDLNRQLEASEGLAVIISDRISVNRSVRDTRPKV